MAKWSLKKRIGKYILHIFFPNHCAICDNITDYNRILCKECEAMIEPHSMPVCKKCGTPIKDHDTNICKPICCPVITAFYYDDQVKRLILDFKDHQRDDVFDAFKEQVYDRIINEYTDVQFDMTASVPSYEKKRHSTSERMAREIAETFFLKYDKDLLIKYRPTEKQHMLTQAERMVNLNDSITYNKKKKELIEGKTILLCDDVKSTGITLNECAKALYAGGAKQVYCICIAVSDYIAKISKEREIRERLKEREMNTYLESLDKT